MPGPDLPVARSLAQISGTRGRRGIFARMAQDSREGLRAFPVLRGEQKADPMAPIDRAWLRMDEPENLMQVTGVLVLDGHLGVDQARALLSRRLEGLPRFGQQVMVDRSGYVWASPANLRIEEHVVEEVLPPPGGDVELAESIGRWASRPLDRWRPLWEFRLLQGYEGSNTVILGRLHHAIGDGVALMVVLLALADPPEASGDAPQHSASAPAASADAPFQPRGGNPFLALLRERSQELLEVACRHAERWMPETYRLMVAPVEAYAKVSSGLRQLASASALSRLAFRSLDPPSSFKGKLGIEKRVAWTDAIPLDQIRGAARSRGVSINELLNSAMAGGMRRYLERRSGVDDRFQIRCAMPVNLRPLAEMASLGNRFGLIFLPLPIGIQDSERRLEVVRAQARALRNSAEPLVVLGLLRLAGNLPEAGQKLLVQLFGAKATAVFTNVPGPRSPLAFAGRKIREIYFWVPQAGRLGLGVSIFSYAGKVRMGVATDAGLVPDPSALVEGFHAELDTLL